MGPVEPARKAILAALEQGKSVVTANKALMAVSTGELAQAAEHAHVDLYFEAAVAGAIPVIRPLTQSLAGDTVLRVAGIVNGTTNYILSEMDSTGADYDVAPWPTRALSATPKPTRPPTSRATTPPPRPRSWPRSPSTPASPPMTSTARASPRSRRPTSRRRVHWAARSSCWRSASDSPPMKDSNGFRPASIPRWYHWTIRWPRSTVRSTRSLWRLKPRAG